MDIINPPLQMDPNNIWVPMGAKDSGNAIARILFNTLLVPVQRLSPKLIISVSEGLRVAPVGPESQEVTTLQEASGLSAVPRPCPPSTEKIPPWCTIQSGRACGELPVPIHLTGSLHLWWRRMVIHRVTQPLRPFLSREPWDSHTHLRHPIILLPASPHLES